MSFIAFKVSDYEHTAEREQYRTICNLLLSKYQARDEICIFIANFNISDCSLDGLLIKSDAIISIEFKNYSGEIIAVENGDWTTADGTIIKGGSRKSVYQQAKVNHVALKNGLRELNVLPNKLLKDIPSLVVFSEPIILHNYLSGRVKSWLQICDSEHFIEKIEDITTPHFNLSNNDILELPPKLGVFDKFIDSRFSSPINILPSKHSCVDNVNVDEPQTSIVSTERHESKTISKPLDLSKTKFNSIKSEYHKFIECHIITTINLSSDYKLLVVHYDDFEKIIGLALSFKSEYVAILQTENAYQYINILKRLLNKDVVSLSLDVIAWGEGEFTI